jgi:hypothetical protein
MKTNRVLNKTIKESTEIDVYCSVDDLDNFLSYNTIYWYLWGFINKRKIRLLLVDYKEDDFFENSECGKLFRKYSNQHYVDIRVLEDSEKIKIDGEDVSFVIGNKRTFLIKNNKDFKNNKFNIPNELSFLRTIFLEKFNKKENINEHVYKEQSNIKEIEYITTINIDGQLMDVDYNYAALMLYFNKYGLKVQWSPEENNYKIMFKDNVSDEQIEYFIIKHEELRDKGWFIKQPIYKKGKYVNNWCFMVEYNNCYNTIEYLKKVFEPYFKWDLEQPKRLKKSIKDENN